MPSLASSALSSCPSFSTGAACTLTLARAQAFISSSIANGTSIFAGSSPRARSAAGRSRPTALLDAQPAASAARPIAAKPSATTGQPLASAGLTGGFYGRGEREFAGGVSRLAPARFSTTLPIPDTRCRTDREPGRPARQDGPNG